MSVRDVGSSGDRSALLAFGGTCLLFAVAPFERLRPIFHLGWQNITTVEAAMGLASAAWLVAVLTTGNRPRWRTALTAPWIVWLAVAAIAALLAPAFRPNALKTTGRMAAGLVVVLLPLNGITTTRRMTVAIRTAAVSAAVVATLATLEYAGTPGILRWLDAFREGVRVVGGQVRASGPLQYPTIASMYLEIVFALTLGALLAAFDRRSRLEFWMLFVSLAVIAEGVIVTFTRAGLITMGVSLLVVAGARVARHGRDAGVAALGALAVVIVGLVFSSTSVENLRLRLTTEGQNDWYRAGFLAPAELALGAGSLNVVEVEVTNRGRMTWSPDAVPPFYLSYHWFDEGMRHVVAYDGLRTALPRAIAPGDAVRARLRVRAPRRAGQYDLGWDIVQENRLWFSTEPGARSTISSATVTGVPPTGPAQADVVLTALPVQATRIGRPTLWRIAGRLVAAHPWLGLGPDNFRLSYIPYTGAQRGDPRVTSNDMYLEVLTGSGVLGLAAFGWLVWNTGRTIRDARRRLTGAAASLYLGVVAAATAIALHGVVDSFLTLTPTYLVMSLVLGLAVAPWTWTADPAVSATGHKQCA